MQESAHVSSLTRAWSSSVMTLVPSAIECDPPAQNCAVPGACPNNLNPQCETCNDGYWKDANNQCQREFRVESCFTVLNLVFQLVECRRAVTPTNWSRATGNWASPALILTVLRALTVSP